MKFNIVNNVQEKIEKTILSNLGDGFKSVKKVSDISIQSIIIHLNESKLLNPAINTEIEIIFENFTILGKIKEYIKSFKKTSLKENLAFYHSGTKNISIYEDFLTNKNNGKLELKLISKSSSNDFLINHALLHEIGHAIQHNYSLEVKPEKKNITEYFNIYESKKLSIINNQALIVRENFADLFATISMLIINKNNPNVLNDLKAFTQYREDRATQENEKYYTYNSLKKLIKDYENNNIQFNSFEDIYQYISNTTEIELKNRLKENLEQSTQVEIGINLGYLSELFKLQSDKLSTTLKFLDDNINYQLSKNIPIMSEDFKNGKQLFMAESSNNIINKMLNLRKNFYKNEISDKLKIK